MLRRYGVRSKQRIYQEFLSVVLGVRAIILYDENLKSHCNEWLHAVRLDYG